MQITFNFHCVHFIEPFISVGMGVKFAKPVFVNHECLNVMNATSWTRVRRKHFVSLVHNAEIIIFISASYIPPLPLICAMSYGCHVFRHVDTD